MSIDVGMRLSTDVTAFNGVFLSRYFLSLLAKLSVLRRLQSRAMWSNLPHT